MTTPHPRTMMDAAETNVLASLAVLGPDRLDEVSKIMDAIDEDNDPPAVGQMEVKDLLVIAVGNLHRINKRLREAGWET